VHGVGYVEPASEVRRLVFKNNGVIDQCRVHAGDKARKGEVLMTLRNQEEQAALRSAEKELQLAIAERDKVLRGINPFEIAVAEKKLDLFRGQLRFLIREQERTQGMFRNRAVSDAEHEKARTDVAQTETSLRHAEAEVRHLRNFVMEEDRRVVRPRLIWRRRGCTKPSNSSPRRC
jgi:HlyD family secretion protein